MQRLWLSLAMFGLFLIEGTIMKWIIPVVWQGQVSVSTHFTLVVVLFISIFVNRHLALAYGLAFGLLHDVVYYGPTMIGTYSFAMGISGYLAGLVTLRSRGNILSSMFMITFGNVLFEGIVCGLYRLFQVNKLPLDWLFFHQMLPSILINLLFALLVYVPLRKWLEDIALRNVREE